jgi:hypothetical protein
MALAYVSINVMASSITDGVSQHHGNNGEMWRSMASAMWHVAMWQCGSV